jgi:transcriptional regulator with PAS, ATPase and Fis domain
MTMLPPTFHRHRDAVRRGDGCRASGRFREAIAAYTEAMVVRGEDLTPDQEASLRGAIAECCLGCGDFDMAELTLAPTEALDAARLLPGTRGALHTIRGFIALHRGFPEQTVREATHAWDVLRDTRENYRVSRALTCRGHGLRRLGRIAEASDDFTDAMAAARRAGNDHEVGLAASSLGFLLWQTGQYDEARTFHLRAIEIHEQTGSEVHLTRELFALSVEEFHLGDWQQVDALLTRCEERARRADDKRLLVSIDISRGRLELYRGQDPRERLESARAIAEAGGYAHDVIGIAFYLAEAASERGEWSHAHELLLEARRVADATAPQGETNVEASWRLARIESVLGESSRVHELLAEALAVAEERGYRAQIAFVRRAMGEALARERQWDAARVHLNESLEIFRNLQMRFETGRGLLALARCADDGETSSAVRVALFREAERILGELGAEREATKATDGVAVRSGATVRRRGADADPFLRIVTEAPLMSEAIARARRIAPSDIPVLLTGATGTGKELFARALHDASNRASMPFHAINCAALSETLLEAELFGHERGAFTGAIAAKPGIFEAADGGTVFLDEIGKAPLSLQAKLLRVLDTGEVRRVGGVAAIHMDVRIVAATNRSLAELVDEQSFLPDLLYRLRGFEIAIPPLTEREGDVPLLFEHFARRPLTDGVRRLLEEYEWPGNVRELRNLAESAAFLMFGEGPITTDALPDWIRSESPAPVPARAKVSVPSLLLSEREAVLRALEASAGNRSRAARALGISRQTLYTKMAKWGLHKSRAA